MTLHVWCVLFGTDDVDRSMFGWTNRVVFVAAHRINQRMVKTRSIACPAIDELKTRSQKNLNATDANCTGNHSSTIDHPGWQ